MNSSDNFQDSALSRLMPLMNSSFTPGQAQATVDNFQDLEQRQIAQAELYYFSGRAEECRNIAELYLQDKDLCLRLSAALLYSFCQLSGHGTDASSHRRTSSSSGFSAIFTLRASRLCCLCPRS